MIGRAGKGVGIHHVDHRCRVINVGGLALRKAQGGGQLLGLGYVKGAWGICGHVLRIAAADGELLIL